MTKLYLYNGESALLKHRFAKGYRHAHLDHRLRCERMRSEVRALIRAKTVNVRTPTILLADEKEGVIIMENLMPAFSTCKFIIERFNSEQKGMISDDGTGEDDGKLKCSKQLFIMASCIGLSVGNMHSKSLIHGDLTTSNLMFDESNSKLFVIDFGLGSQEGTFEDKAVDLYVLERALLTTRSQHLFNVVLDSYKKANAEQWFEGIMRDTTGHNSYTIGCLKEFENHYFKLSKLAVLSEMEVENLMADFFEENLLEPIKNVWVANRGFSDLRCAKYAICLYNEQYKAQSEIQKTVARALSTAMAYSWSSLPVDDEEHAEDYWDLYNAFWAAYEDNDLKKDDDLGICHRRFILEVGLDDICNDVFEEARRRAGLTLSYDHNEL